MNLRIRMVVVTLLASSFVEARAERPRFSAAYIAAYQDMKVWGTSDLEVYQVGRVRKFQPLGAELGLDWMVTPSLVFQADLRGQQGRLRFSGTSGEQSYWDGMASIGLKAGMARLSWGSLWLTAGLRWRSWFFSTGIYQNSHQAGGYIGFAHAYRAVESDVEAGLMAFGFGSESIGRQRDSSTLRVRTRYRLRFDGWSLLPGLDFFHTHRSYYGAMIDVAKQSYFIDDLRFGATIGAEF